MRTASSPGQDDSTTLPPGAISALLEELVRSPEPDRPAQERLAQGARIGRFQIVRELGRGGFGVVYEALDTELGRAVAFKVVRPGRRSQAREGRLLREAEAAARLSHPNVVTLYDLGRSEHGPYLVLELLRGETLGARLSRGRLERSEALRVAVEVARGLAHAHGCGVVHRDLSPGNVFLCEDGRVKILDLGLASAFGRDLLRGGTPGHMAPEQREGGVEDACTDVFALGALLVVMLGGDVPERGLGPGERPPVRRGGALPRLLQRMLAREPRERPRDAGQVVGPLEQMGRPERRRTLRAGLLCAAALAAVAVGLFLRRPMPVALSGASLAVLPFDDETPAHDHGPLAEGLAADLADELSRFSALRVAGHESALKVHALPPNEAAARLRVASLLTGRVRQDGERLLVAVRLLQGKDGREVWAQEYEARAGGVFALQAALTHAVAGALRVDHSREATGPTVAPPAEAVELVWRTRQEISAGGAIEAERWLAWAERAVGLAPRWGRARALLGRVRFGGWLVTGFEQACQQGLADLDEAVRLDPALGEAWAWRGYLRLHCAIEVAGAQADTERALALAPRDAEVLRRAGAVSLFSARRDEAILRFREAADLDPLAPECWTWLGRAYWSALRFAEARAAVERAMALAPAGWQVALLGLLALEEGRPQEALGFFERASPSQRLRGLAMALHDLGQQAEAEEALRSFAHQWPENAVVRAQVYAWWGDRERAIAELSGNLAGAHVGKVEVLHDPTLRSLRSDPRWPALMRLAGFP